MLTPITQFVWGQKGMVDDSQDRPRIYFVTYFNFPQVLPGDPLLKMHWQYYQKAITTYFALSNAITVQANQQHPLVLPGDGGNLLIYEDFF